MDMWWIPAAIVYVAMATLTYRALQADWMRRFPKDDDPPVGMWWTFALVPFPGWVVALIDTNGYRWLRRNGVYRTISKDTPDA